MQGSSHRHLTGTLLIFSITLILTLFGCRNQGEFEDIEIRDYQGERLDSISDFRENSIKGPQYINASDYSLKITGLVDDELRLTYDGVLAYPQINKLVTLHCVEGWRAKILWTGVRVEDLLADAGIGSRADTLIFRAYDGYTTSLPLSSVLDNDIIIAYEMNNVTLPPERGYPFQLVAEDKWGYKWIKWITEIEVSSNSSYKGYWEEVGYSQSGDLDKPSI